MLMIHWYEILLFPLLIYYSQTITGNQATVAINGKHTLDVISASITKDETANSKGPRSVHG